MILVSKCFHKTYFVLNNCDKFGNSKRSDESFFIMSENQVLNSTPSNQISKPSPTRRIPTSPKSSGQMEATLEKQKQILDQYKEANAALTKYKEKTEESIAQSKKILEEEKKKNSDMINDITLKNEAILNEKKLENDRKIQELKEAPLFNNEPVQTMKDSCAEMKSNVEELKADFSNNFQNLMNDIHEIHSKVLSQKAEKQNEDKNNEIETLDKSVSDNKVNESAPAVFERSVNIEEEEEICYTPHLTAFLKRYAIENAKWLA